MGKIEVIAEEKASLLAAQDAALESTLGNVWDKAWVAKPTEGGGFTQEDIDIAVKQALEADQVKDQEAMDALEAKAKEDMAALQAQFDALKEKDLSDEALISNLKESLASVQNSVAAVLALFNK